MAKYFLITVRSENGFTNTFVEEGESTYDAFILKCKLSKDKNGFVHHSSNSIIFSQEATKKDYELYQKHQKG
jgi:hypothetical protein